MALPTLQGPAAHRVIDELAASHARHGHHIRAIGRWLLDRASRGLRDGRARRTYDVTFVGDRGAFACITVAAGKWNRVEDGKLRLEARFDGMPRGLRMFRPKARREAERGWHYAHLAPADDVGDLLRELEGTRS